MKRVRCPKDWLSIYIIYGIMRSEVVSMCIHPPAIEENTTSGGVTSHSEMPWGLRDVNPKA